MSDIFIISAIFIFILCIFAIIFVTLINSYAKERQELVKIIASKNYSEYASFNTHPEEKQNNHVNMVNNQLKKMNKSKT